MDGLHIFGKHEEFLFTQICPFAAHYRKTFIEEVLGHHSTQLLKADVVSQIFA